MHIKVCSSATEDGSLSFHGDDVRSTIQEVASRIFSGLKTKGVYVNKASKQKREKHWRSLPLNASSEGAIYQPLTEILNAITKECTEARFNLSWSDEHSRKLESHFSVDIKPDIVATFTYGVGSNSPSVWWRSTHTLIEVKKQANALPAATQLLRYVRQALREQPDRRFMYGLVFAKRNLTVWHVDPSGALASEAFDVHKEPMRFVQVIVAFLTKKPEELGWDPTMQMFANLEGEPKGRGVFSYEIDANNTDIEGSGPYGRMWLATIHKASSGSDSESTVETEEFVLFRALNLSRAEVIRGRATRVWKAWRREDMPLPKESRPIFVFKDSWRDERRGLEGDLYAEAGPCDGVAKLYCYGVVHIGSSEDSTLSTIRKGINPEGRALDLSTSQSEAAQMYALDSDTYLMPSCKPDAVAEDFFLYDTNAGTPRNRIHTRIVMSTYGRGLTHFLSLSELLRAMCDAIAGHRNLYVKGILHRDISSGNILLTGQARPNEGVIIDLDYGIRYKSHETISDDKRSGTTAFMSPEILDNRPYEFAPPDPSGYEESYTVKEAGVKHNFIHDLESAFWVLCWICVMRSGPGTRRELWSEDPEESTLMQRAIYATFEDPNFIFIAARKRELLGSPKLWGQTIIAAVAPYFRPLVKTLNKLHYLLYNAYRTRDFSRVHTEFLAALEAAEASEEVRNWHDIHPQYQLLENAEKARRRADLAIAISPKAERMYGAEGPNASRPDTIVEEDEEQGQEDEERGGEADSSPLASSRTKARKKPTALRGAARVSAEAGSSALPRRSSLRLATKKSDGQGGDVGARMEAGSSTSTSRTSRKRRAPGPTSISKGTKKQKR